MDNEQFSFRWGVSWLDDTGWISVPGFIKRHYAQVGVKPIEMMLICHLSSYRFESARGESKPSLVTVSIEMGYKSDSQVRAMVRRLKKLGLLTVTHVSGETNIYEFKGLAMRCMELEIKTLAESSQGTLAESSYSPYRNPATKDIEVKKEKNNNSPPSKTEQESIPMSDKDSVTMIVLDDVANVYPKSNTPENDSTGFLYKDELVKVNGFDSGRLYLSELRGWVDKAALAPAPQEGENAGHPSIRALAAKPRRVRSSPNGKSPVSDLRIPVTELRTAEYTNEDAARLEYQQACLAEDLRQELARLFHRGLTYDDLSNGARETIRSVSENLSKMMILPEELEPMYGFFTGVMEDEGWTHFTAYTFEKHYSRWDQAGKPGYTPPGVDSENGAGKGDGVAHVKSAVEAWRASRE